LAKKSAKFKKKKKREFTWRKADDVVDPQVVVVEADRRTDLSRHVEA